MKAARLALPELVRLIPEIRPDECGRFSEAYSANDTVGEFVHGEIYDAVSWNLRGLYYQTKDPQGRLVSCIKGRVFVVAADMRQRSQTLGQQCGIVLDDLMRHSFWMPPGFAFGFLALDFPATVFCNCTSQPIPEFARTVRWDDGTLAIQWPTGIGRMPVLTGKDRNAGTFADAEKVAL